EKANDEMYETRFPGGLYSELKEFFALAIGAAGRADRPDEAARLTRRLDHCGAVYRKHFSSGGARANCPRSVNAPVRGPGVARGAHATCEADVAPWRRPIVCGPTTAPCRRALPADRDRRGRSRRSRSRAGRRCTRPASEFRSCCARTLRG